MTAKAIAAARRALDEIEAAIAGKRCPCGANPLARAKRRAFDCCKRAGLMPRGKRGRPPLCKLPEVANAV
jgi:hypothetical protein